MNREQTEEAIRVLTDNPDVEVSFKRSNNWHVVSDMEFRINPEPVELWVVLRAIGTIVVARDEEDAWNGVNDGDRVILMREVVEGEA